MGQLCFKVLKNLLQFQPLYEASTGDFVLMITSLQQRDEGMYECQIGTTPPKAHPIYLNIIGQCNT